jgi:hypothetical protein
VSDGPAVVAHADWSVDAKKRWMAVAVRRDGRWDVAAPEPVGEPSNLLARLRDRANSGVVAGFDFPIGLPAGYAERAGIGNFTGFLDMLGRPPWDHIGEVAERPEDITLHRPFYPARPGGTRRAHLLEALGVPSTVALRRRCEHATPHRPAAECLFWTLGGKQVGKAALAGWRTVLNPARRNGSVRLWPFEGRLSALLQSGADVIVETYPAEFYRHLGVRFGEAGNGKRSQPARRANADPLMRWAARAGVMLTPAAESELRDGFGSRSDGEDRFDAAVGLMGMLNLVLGLRPFHEPSDPTVRAVEGWILGQAGPQP